MIQNRFLFTGVLLMSFLILLSCGQAGTSTEKPAVIRLDYATYNPASLVLKVKGWAEEAFAEEGITVEWTFSQGSNRALTFLQGDNIDFGSSAGAAALISASNGNPVEIVYLYSKPEWTALVAPSGSAITQIADLKGKKVAATLGTDPYIFLLRSLSSVGLSEKDIELVPLQHGDGATALLSGQVDAWAGLDPHMARVELESGANLFYRNIDFNTYGVLNVRSEFAETYPAYVEKVIRLYERARAYLKENLAEGVTILALEAQINPAVAELQLTQRTDLSNPLPDQNLSDALNSAGSVLQIGGHIKPDVDVAATVRALVQPQWAQQALK